MDRQTDRRTDRIAISVLTRDKKQKVDSTCTQYCRRSALYKLLCMYVDLLSD